MRKILFGGVVALRKGDEVCKGYSEAKQQYRITPYVLEEGARPAYRHVWREHAIAETLSRRIHPAHDRRGY